MVESLLYSQKRGLKASPVTARTGPAYIWQRKTATTHHTYSQIILSYDFFGTVTLYSSEFHESGGSVCADAVVTSDMRF